jgi:hypothetical protein
MIPRKNKMEAREMKRHCDRDPDFLKLKQTQKDLVKQAAHHVWNQVCYDVIPEGGFSITRSDVIEIVTDQFEFHTNGKDVRAIFRNMTFEERMEALEEAFPSERYSR